MLGALYFLTIIDDFSHHTWIYFLKHKSKALKKFREFCGAMITLTDQTIKSLCTDQGGEFMSHEFQP
jgi:hypothetical protein